MVRTMASGPPAGAGATSPSRRPPTPSGVLFFVHGANETSEGLAENVTRIEDQVRARGWDVTVVAPEWRRRSDLRLGAWQKAIDSGVKDVALTTESVESAGDLAAETGKVRLVARDGTASEARYVVVWRRVGGEWKLHRDIWNAEK